MRWFGVALLVLVGSRTFAQAPCPMCQKPIVPSRAVYAVFVVNGKTQRFTFRCIQCALHAVKHRRPEKALLRTRCVAMGRWVTFRWDRGSWSAQPNSARLLLAAEKDGECLDRHLVFVDTKTAHRFLRSRPSLASEPILSIAQATKSEPGKVR